jgi:putative PIN family toxin of toxin-antitoxin system
MSGKNIKAFLDANTIVSGLLFTGNEATLLELGRIKAIELITNKYVIEEVSNVLARPEFNLTPREIKGLQSYLYLCLNIYENPSKDEIDQNLSLLNDKKDTLVALGSQQANTDYLVTGDKELLEKIKNAITTRLLLEKILPKS